MAKVLVIGCGNVGSVGLHKMAQFPDIFSEISVINRSREKARRVRASMMGKILGSSKVLVQIPDIFIGQADISEPGVFLEIVRTFRPDLLVHWGHPYHNLTIMEACLKCGVPYIDTACYENPKELGFSHELQWAMDEDFRKTKLLALLGAGFDPGVTNVFCAYARDYLFDEVHHVDILDCNAGARDEKIKFAPNFDPEINLRELILPVRFWENGEWKERGRLIDENPVKFDLFYPDAGRQQTCMIYHEEMESLIKHLPHLKRIRFFMTFGDSYLWHLRVLKNVGMIGIEPVIYEGHPVIPVKFLKALLPKGDDFNQTYTGKTCIGCVISGIKAGKQKIVFIYQVCDHHEAFLETGGNAIGYTTAIPTVTAAKLLLEGRWGKGVTGVRNTEDPAFDSKIFLEELAKMGLPWVAKELDDIPEPLKKDF